MNAVVIKAFGGPEVFEQREVPKPAPRSKQVLVRVMATSVNPLDYQIRRGDYRAYVTLPAIIGFDVSGIIEGVGDAVTDFKVGDEVYYTPQIFNGDGSYAEYHLADEINRCSQAKKPIPLRSRKPHLDGRNCLGGVGRTRPAAGG